MITANIRLEPLPKFGTRKKYPSLIKPRYIYQNPVEARIYSKYVFKVAIDYTKTAVGNFDFLKKCLLRLITYEIYFIDLLIHVAMKQAT